MMEIIPNCYNCKKKQSGEFKSNNVKIKLDNGREVVALICWECKRKEEERERKNKS
ncbi:MAG: hypothetical protein I3273_04860 [Candidatus Moeniiplasma glomeromycotorum]|nr:hypothetical protein [Candidatus Moeniiplasma glomeromycotorum]MCE8169422.1 hypothetical protein [Candidatus Moeniiplasma glomeromycotorum]